MRATAPRSATAKTRTAAALGVAAALTLGPLLALAPGAAASGVNGADITLVPDSVRPGGTVGLIVNCSSAYFGTPHPTVVSSMAFVTSVRLHPTPGRPGFFSGAATISHDIRPGDYNVSGACQESNTSLSTFNATLEIPGKDHGGDDRRPHGPVHTGVGGSVDPGSDTQVAVGLGLAGLGGGALYLSRRRRGAE
ncbi:hypothetical protein [Streptacidiphilus rugosus]|uniref:hypothetical protein n=1 Tax=Streptacidiphilus rugosus TaxID=405783 RepID=UPI0005649CDF|nr:hypothetical protein [Streptacidiphilus rugosus]